MPRRRRITTAVSLVVASLLSGWAAGEAVVEGNNVTFRLDARHWHDKPKRVHVAGSFQGWNKDQTALEDPDGDLIWEKTLKLDDGQHQYKFVIDGERWITDPTGDRELEVNDNHGGMNSGVIVGFDIRKAPPPKPNAINADAVRFDPSNPADLNVFAPGKVRIRVRAQAGDVERAGVYVGWQQYPTEFPELRKVGTDGGLDVFAGTFTVDPRLATPVKIGVQLIDGEAQLTVPVRQGEPYFPLDQQPAFDTPEWAKHAVWYQIFPERFRNGDPSNDPGEFPFENLIDWKSNWWEAQVEAGEKPGDENFYGGAGNVWRRRYGGDIQGVKEMLPYLRELGVNAIYFNPIFEAESMHKYDTADFRHIDDNFGVKGDIARLEGETVDPATWKWTESDRLFLDFIAEAHRQGFKVVIDGVFNHVGRAHPFFMDVLEKGKNSPFADWFEITDWGDESNWRKMDDPFAVHGKPGGIQWKAWDGDSGHLPVFRKDPNLGLAPGPREHIMAITKRWLDPDGDPATDDGIDGWRLDVANDIPHPFWRDWRKVVKETKPDAYITGEIWSWAQPWLNDGDQFDAVMNYQYAMAAQDFFVDQAEQIKPSEFASRLMQLQMAYPFQVALVMQNLFDSHDTDRLASMFVNPDRPYDGANRPQDNAANRPYSDRKPTAEEWQRLKQAVANQMTFVGAPMIYYGTEVGMWSPDDPSNRQPMVWRDLLPYEDPRIEFNADLFAFFQRMIATRQALEPLRLGFYVPLVTDDDRNVLVYSRTTGDQQHVYVAINRSDAEQQVVIPVAPVDAGRKLLNYLDPAHVELIQPDLQDPTARPAIKFVGGSGHLPQNGQLTLTLPPYGTAVLAAERSE